MKQQITFRQYRTLDLFFFTALLCLCESLIVLGATRWFPGEPYTLSLTAAVTAIVIVRWGFFAAVPAVLGAFVFCLVSGAALPQYMIYCIGNLLSLLMVLFVRKAGWQRLRDHVLLAMLHGLMTAVLMQLGRFIIAFLLGNDPIVCLGFITTDVLSSLFAVIIAWICRRLDGMLEDQTHYLKRVQEEKTKTRGSEPWQ